MEKFNVERDYEANALAELSTNPGIKPESMLELAKRVIRETEKLTYRQQIRELEYLARKQMRMENAETEVILKSVPNKVSHVFTDLEPTDQDHQPRFGYDPDGNGAA